MKRFLVKLLLLLVRPEQKTIWYLRWGSTGTTVLDPKELVERILLEEWPYRKYELLGLSDYEARRTSRARS